MFRSVIIVEFGLRATQSSPPWYSMFSGMPAISTLHLLTNGNIVGEIGVDTVCILEPALHVRF